MKRQYLLSAAFIAAVSTAAFAQSPSSTSSSQTSPSATSQPSTSAPSTSTTTPSATSPSTSTSTAPSTSTGTSPQRTTQTGTSSSPTTPSNSTASQTTPSAGTNQAQQAPSTPPSNNTANTTTPNSGGATNTNNAAAPSATQQPSNTANTATPNTNVNANVNANVNLDDRQRTRVSEAFSRVNVRPLTNVNFSVSIGTVVPRDVRLETVPTDIVTIVPQYRGYSYFAVRDEIVIVEPSTLKIVTILPRGGSSSAQAPAPAERRAVSTETRSKSKFSDSDREVVRKHVKARSDRERRTVGSTASTSVRIGERVPDTVEIHTFTDDDYRTAPTLRQYRYIQHENRAYIVEPGERRIIEEID